MPKFGLCTLKIEKMWRNEMEAELKKIDDIDELTLAATQLIIDLGSKSDWDKWVKASKMHKILNEIGISYIAVAISAHRNPKELEKFCIRAVQANPNVVFVGIAGGAAALPGAIAAILKERPVIGVALPSETFPDASDAVLAMTQTPGDIAINFAGIAENGLQKVPLLAAQILGQGHMATRHAYKKFLNDHRNDKEPEVLLVKRQQRTENE